MIGCGIIVPHLNNFISLMFAMRLFVSNPRTQLKNKTKSLKSRKELSSRWIKLLDEKLDGWQSWWMRKLIHEKVEITLRTNKRTNIANSRVALRLKTSICNTTLLYGFIFFRIHEWGGVWGAWLICFSKNPYHSVGVI